MSIPEWSTVKLPDPIDPPFDGYDQSAEIFNVPCIADTAIHTVKWRNLSETGSRDILITRAYLWSGLVIDHTADIWVKLIRKIDESPVHIQVWDRYANPSEPHGVWKQCNHILPHEGRLDMQFFCDSISVTQGLGVHFAAAIDFRYL